MSVTVPARAPEIENDRDLEQRVAELEALIEEARRRARRRRRLYAAVVLAAIAAGAAAVFDIGGNGGVSLGRSDASGSPGPAATQSGAARWRPLHGPQGGTVFAIAIAPADSKIVYAAGWGRLFNSSNGGASWQDVSVGEPWKEIASLAIDPMHPSVVYVGSDRGVGKTVDGGLHWRMVNTGLFDPPPLPPRTAPPNGSLAGSLTIDPQHPATVYTMTGRGLYRTRNGGARWQIIGPPVLRNPICRNCPIGRSYSGVSFAIAPNHAQTIYATGLQAAGLLYESSDGGDSWRRITMSPAHSFSALALTASGTLLGTDQVLRGVYRSIDGGTTWNPAGPAGETIDAITVDPGSGAIYATTSNGAAAFRTTDGGDSWQTVPTNLAWFGTVTDPNNQATVYATTNDGVVKSVDHGKTWAAADQGLVSRLISAIALAPGSPPTLYAGSGGSVFKSTDRGRTWRAESAGLDGTYVVALAVEPQNRRTLYAVEQGRGLFKSSDAGVHWGRVQTAFPSNGVQAIAIDPQHPRTVYISDCGGACAAGAFQKTDDGGASWRPITGIPWTVQSLAIDPQHPNTVFAGTVRGDIFRSSDGARSWHRVATAPTLPKSRQYAIDGIAIDPRDPDNIYAVRRTGGIIKSSDGGETWARANAGLTNLDMYALAVDPHKPQVLLASTYGGVFMSTNGAKSWQPYGRGLPAGGVAAFAFDPAGSTVYAGTNGDGVDSLRVAR